MINKCKGQCESINKQGGGVNKHTYTQVNKQENLHFY